MRHRKSEITTRESFAGIEAGRFVEPEAFCGPVYIWAWNDQITAKALRTQLGDMRRHGVRGVWVLPWPNIRPLTNPTSMSPDYLSPAYMKLYRFMVEEAKRLGMIVWLYDEGGWPSGGVCGRIVRDRPELARQSLERRELRPRRGETVEIPGDCLWAGMYEKETPARKLRPGERVRVVRAHTRVVVFKAKRHGQAEVWTMPYPDLLNPKVTREFLRRTHEEFRKLLGRHFGTLIPLMFTDEPKVNNPPWTDGLAEDFQRRYGYDVRPRLGSILGGASDHDQRVRIDFFDWWSRRFAENYFGRIQDWCERHGLASSGHLGGEDWTEGPAVYGYGHPLRIYRRMDIPGVDTIWRQVFPFGPGSKKGIRAEYRRQMRNHHFPKYASSVAHQDGKRWVITESFAIYGAGLTPAEMKWITDYQYVRGVNLMSVGGCLLSTRDHYMGGPRPMFGPMNPLWKHLDAYHTYTARLSYLLSLGEPHVDTAVYYPIRDVWAKGPDLRDVASSNDRLARTLAERQVDFDFVDDDLLGGRSSRVVKGGLRVGRMAYRRVFISRSRWMTEAARATLKAFIRAGGRVVWVDRPASAPRIAGSVDASLKGLHAHVEPLVRVVPARKDIRVCRRRLAGGNLYFVTNEGIRPLRCTIRFAEDQTPMMVDVERGGVYAPPCARRTKAGWEIPLRLAFAGSCVVLFGEAKGLTELGAPAGEGRTLLELARGWRCRKVREYRLGKRNFEIVARRGPWSPVRLGDWRRVLGDGFSGDAEYRVTFNCSEELVRRAEGLDLGTVRYACEAELNGRRLGRRIWPPFTLSLNGALRAGRNELRVTVTNTMANQFVTTKVLDRWPDNVIGGYHRIAKMFEPQSTPSGLFGPVRLVRTAKTPKR